MASRSSRNGLDRLRLAIGYSILATWLGAFVVSVIKPEFDVSPALQALMTLVAGISLAPTIFSGKNGNGKNGGDSE